MTITAPAKKVRLAIACTSEERKRIKMLASYEEKTLNDFVMDCVRLKISKCNRSHIPNEETEKALSDSEQGKGIRKHSSIDEMFKFLGI